MGFSLSNILGGGALGAGLGALLAAPTGGMSMLAGGLLGGGIGAGAGAAGLLDGTQPGVVADPYGSTREALTGWLNQNLGKSGPTYSGETTAPMSEQEKKSLSKLDDYSNYNLANDQTFQNAKSEINKTLTNQYDPTTSPYYQAVKAEAARNLSQTNKDIASQAAGGGRYYTGARMKQQREAGVDVTNSLNTMLGSLAEKERQNRLNIIPQALGLSQQESQMPLQQATALQSLGALPRTIAQAKDQASLEDWLRSNYQWPLSVASVGAGVQAPPVYSAGTPSVTDSLLSGAGQMLPNLLMFKALGLGK